MMLDLGYHQVDRRLIWVYAPTATIPTGGSVGTASQERLSSLKFSRNLKGRNADWARIQEDKGEESREFEGKKDPHIGGVGLHCGVSTALESQEIVSLPSPLCCLLIIITFVVNALLGTPY
jgi:hypothetical protein